MKSFGSDNHSGIHPKILEKIIEVNRNHSIAYGNDLETKKALENFKKLFGNDTEVFFVFNGTAANVLALKSVCNSFDAVICAETSHMNTDECGAPENIIGCKLITIPTKDGKITASQIEEKMKGFGAEHHSQPKVVSITQPTEYGTLYTLDEIREITETAHKYNCLLHMDGARISNAAVSLKKSFKEFTKDAGIDLLSFGGTKNGMMFGEAVIFFDKNLAKNFKFIRKQNMQLYSKMRFVSSQFNAFLENELWKKNAEHANKMTQLLAEQLKATPNFKITQKVETNEIFAIMPKKAIQSIQEKFFFYIWNETTNECRFVTSWDTTKQEVEDFAEKIRKELNGS